MTHANKIVYLLRHGISEATVGHFYSGGMDVPLTEGGRAALRELRYPLADFYATSPLSRAVETLHILYEDVDARLVPELMECSFGEYEGHTYEELKERSDYIAWITDESGDFAPPGGESRNTHAARVCAGMAELLQVDFGTAAIVCHGGTIVRLMKSWFQPQKIGCNMQEESDKSDDSAKTFYDWQPACGAGWKITFQGSLPLRYEAVTGRE